MMGLATRAMLETRTPNRGPAADYVFTGGSLPAGATLSRASQGSTIAPFRYGAEMVTNGDFAGGTTTGWSAANATLAVVGGELEATLTGGSGNDIVQNVAGLVAGQMYRFRARMRAHASNATALSSRIYLFNPSAVAILTALSGTLVAANGTNAWVDFTFKALASGTYQILYQVASGSVWGAVSDKGYLDNVSIKQLYLYDPADPVGLVIVPADVARFDWTNGPGAEMVTNGNNEAALMSMGALSSIGLAMSRASFGGANVALAQSSTSSMSAHQTVFATTIPAGAAVEITGKFYVPAAGVAYFRIFDNNDGSWFGINSTTKGSWQSFTLRRTAKNTAWGLGFGNNIGEAIASGTPAFYLDDVSVKTSYAGAAACRGLIREGAQTNLLGDSEFRLGVPPVNSGVTPSSFTGLPGDTGIQFIQNGGTNYCYGQYTQTLNAIYTFSCFLRMDDGGAPVFGADSTTGDLCAIAQNAFTLVPPTVINYGGGLYRVLCTFTALNVAYKYMGIVKYATQSSRGFKVSGYQLVSGVYAGSYIPSTGSAAEARASDLVGYSTNCAGVAECTLGMEFDLLALPSAGGNIYPMATPTTGAPCLYFTDAGWGPGIYAVTAISGKDPAGVGRQKAISSFKYGDHLYSQNGLPPANPTNAVAPVMPATLGAYDIGSGTGLHMILERARIWPRTMSSAELQTVTT